MRYTILVKYRTGDSFHTEDVENTVELEWENLGVARTAMQRIKEHHDWNNKYQYDKDYWDNRPGWYKLLVDDLDYRDSYYIINLPMDNGTEHSFGVFWLGHFETLYSLEIIVVYPEEEGMRITF